MTPADPQAAQGMTSAAARPARPVAPADVAALVRIVGAQLSPDGRRLAWVRRDPDLAADTYRSSLWLAESDDAGRWSSRQLAPGLSNPDGPRWSPDGRRIACLAEAAGSSQLFVLDPDGGEPARLTSLSGGASEPSWSPDGRRIAIVSRAPLVAVSGNPLIRHIRHAPYRWNGEGYVDDQFTHVWVVDVGTGVTRRLTAGPQDDTDVAWSPDGSLIAFASCRPEAPVPAPWWTQIHVIPSDAPAPTDDDRPDGARRVTGDAVNIANRPFWSPDGAVLGCSARAAGNNLEGGFGLFRVDGLDPATTRPITSPSAWTMSTPEFDTVILSTIAPTWTPSGSVVFSAVDRGELALRRADPETGETAVLIGGERAIAHPSLSAAADRVAFLANDWTHPGDLFVANIDGSEETRVTGVNDDLVGGLRTVRPDALAVPTTDGRFVLDAWRYRALGAAPREPRPLILLVHGGPVGSFGPTFLGGPQVLAGHGYDVLLVNPRGGDGRGREFEEASGGRWGEADQQDLLDALDLVIRDGGIDPDAIGVGGLSYGGFMAAWLVGRTDRFHAAYAEGSVTNFISYPLTCDSAGQSDWSVDNWPDLWDEPMEWWRRSPLAHVRSMHAPLLFLVGEQDWRTPPEQAEQLFGALKHRGVPTEMVRFVNGAHGVCTGGEPSVRTERLRLIVDWFDRYLVGAARVTGPATEDVR